MTGNSDWKPIQISNILWLSWLWGDSWI